MKILKGFRFYLAGWFIILSVMVLTGASWAGPVDVGAAKKEGISGRYAMQRHRPKT